ncbi:MAG: hypothetical protein NWE75_01510 [Candidatus Bathyarchaeota archaeon]|jgi:hypothetical protein|nr:hypothetical protein [Candidatus Bathyarchaeota archaeon]
MERPPFRLRVRIGDMEVELGGEKSEVLSTLDDLGEIVGKINVAFNDGTKSKIVQVAQPPEEPSPLDYPKIGRTNQCGEAVVSLLSTDWGKTPRAIGELREAMEANAIFFPKTTLSGVLVWLVKKGQLRRWKDKKRGYLYVINRPEAE